MLTMLRGLLLVLGGALATATAFLFGLDRELPPWLHFTRAQAISIAGPAVSGRCPLGVAVVNRTSRPLYVTWTMPPPAPDYNPARSWQAGWNSPFANGVPGRGADEAAPTEPDYFDQSGYDNAYPREAREAYDEPYSAGSYDDPYSGGTYDDQDTGGAFDDPLTREELNGPPPAYDDSTYSVEPRGYGSSRADLPDGRYGAERYGSPPGRGGVSTGYNGDVAFGPPNTDQPYGGAGAPGIPAGRYGPPQTVPLGPEPSIFTPPGSPAPGGIVIRPGESMSSLGSTADAYPARYGGGGPVCDPAAHMVSVDLRD